MNVHMRRVLGLILVMTLACLGASATSMDVADPRVGLAMIHGGGIPVSVPGVGMRTLLLEPSDVLAPDVRFTVTDFAGRFLPASPEPVWTLKGTVSGDPHSLVRVTITPWWVSGTVVTGGREFDFRRDGSLAAAPSSSATHDAVDVPAPGAGPEEDPVDTPVSGWQVGIGRNNCQVNECGTLTAKIILDGDMFFRNIAPSTCFSRQLANLNELEGIFSRAETDIRFQVTQMNCHTAPDLGPKGTALIPYHERFRDLWAETGNDRSLVHLAVGFDFGDGQALGRTWQPAVCGRISPDPLVVGPPEQRCEHGYTMYQAIKRTGVYRATVFEKAKLAAVLFGAAFNAKPTYAEGCKGTKPRTGTIMCSPMQWEGPNTFSALNAERIRAHAEKTIGYLAETP